MLKYTIAGFRNVLKMSPKKRLLVEGPMDKIAFLLLLEELHGKHSITVHSAESIQGALANREKVEQICQTVSGLAYAERVVGFADREFREFEWRRDFIDHLGKHNVLDRLVWSRGHSIENYCFDFTIFREAFLGYTEYFNEALERFETHFEQTIRLACAATLAGKDFGNRLVLVKSSFNWQIIETTPSSLTLDCDKWEERLHKVQKLSILQAKQFVDFFKSWQKKVERVDFEIVRWLCHGHIGLTFILEVYYRCVFDVCASLTEKERKTQVKRVRSAGYESKLSDALKYWTRQSKENLCEYPREVLNLLEL
jgi:hypothetical protein